MNRSLGGIERLRRQAERRLRRVCSVRAVSDGFV